MIRQRYTGFFAHRYLLPAHAPRCVKCVHQVALPAALARDRAEVVHMQLPVAAGERHSQGPAHRKVPVPLAAEVLHLIAKAMRRMSPIDARAQRPARKQFVEFLHAERKCRLLQPFLEDIAAVAEQAALAELLQIGFHAALQLPLELGNVDVVLHIARLVAGDAPDESLPHEALRERVVLHQALHHQVRGQGADALVHRIEDELALHQAQGALVRLALELLKVALLGSAVKGDHPSARCAAQRSAGTPHGRTPRVSGQTACSASA